MNNDNIVKVELCCRINTFEKDGKSYEYVDYFVIYDGVELPFEVKGNDKVTKQFMLKKISSVIYKETKNK
jgi:penicillin-binding protein-related factor A (putative recombinase)